MNYYYIELRARNCPLGRIKPIRFQVETNPTGYYTINDAYKQIRYDLQAYASSYRLPWFNIDWEPIKKPNKLITSPCFQVNLSSRDYQMPPNAFKSIDEVKEYLMKYYVSWNLEYKFCRYSGWLNIDKQIFNFMGAKYTAYKLRGIDLAKVRIADPELWVKDYNDGKHTMRDQIYQNYSLYKEDRNFIENKLKSENIDTSLMNFLLFADSFKQY